jgi:hypothetical protein
MSNFLTRGNKGNRNIKGVTIKSISITILLPLLPPLPQYIPSRVYGEKLLSYAHPFFLNPRLLCFLGVTKVTKKILDLCISIFLLPLVKIWGYKRVTKEGTV